MEKSDVWGMTVKYKDPIKKIILDNAKHFLHIRLASEEQDMHKSTDLIGEIKVGFAIRVRETTFRDFTVRAMSKYGAKTEIDKLRDGDAECDYYFYFWGDGNGNIVDWILIDMKIFKTSELIKENKQVRPNGDGTGFIPYSVEELRECGCLLDGTL